MGLSFLAPLFFAGLAAIAIPILIHLTYRQKATIIPFPSLMFVQKVPFKSMRRQKIRHWLLFLLRCAALALLVLAFSRPFFDQMSIAATLSSASREVVILIDNSHSMSYGDRWQRAKEAAREAIGDLTPSDRASLVFFSDAAQLAVRSTAESSVLNGALEAIELSRRPTRFAPAIGLAQQLLNESALPAREVVLITDYQKTGFDAEQSVQLPEGTILTGVDVAEEASSNLSIAALTLQREAVGADEQVIVGARLVNQGNEPFNDLAIALELDGERAETLSVSLEPNSAATVQFQPQPIGADPIRGIIHASGDDFPGDNIFFFVVNPGETLSVLLLENSGAHETDSFFFEQALALGTRPAFRVQAKPANQLAATDLAGTSLVVINDAAFPAGSAGADLRAYVEAGGGLFVALGELSRPGDWQSPDAQALLAPFAAEIVDRNAEFGGALASYDRNHAIFEVFRVPRSGDFTAASFYRYWKLEPTDADLVVASFDDGAPAVVAREVAAGRVVVWPTSLDRYWNDLVTQPVFLPFVQKAAEYVAGYREAFAWQVVGGTVRLATLQDTEFPEGTEVEVTSPTGNSASLVARVDPVGSADPDQAPDRVDLTDPGFYELAWSDSAGDRGTVFAANLDRTESDLSKIDAEELAAALSWSGAATSDLELGNAVTREDREAAQSVWWYLLVLVFVVLAAETALSNRLSPSSVSTEA